MTQAEFLKLLNWNPSAFQSSEATMEGQRVQGIDTSRNPVERVSWYDACWFCNKASEAQGLSPYYQFKDVKKLGQSIHEAEVTEIGGSGYRLPHEEEWEHAYRAGVQGRYHNGSDETMLAEIAWYKENSEGRTHVVGAKKSNAFGLHDMSGNVHEWCWEGDASDKKFRRARGGGFSHTASTCIVSYRNRMGSANRQPTQGFRLARTLPGQAP